jgi:NAD(P)-dependent dehydrogenase (short-subunit alcohol dehydrogenase family)
MPGYDPAPDLLKNRIILVTGAGDGIGRVAAHRFAACGATVVLLGRTTRKLEQVYDEIEQAGHPQAAIYPMNLEGASPKDYADLAQVLEAEFGHLDGLLHNAATLGTLTPIAHYDIELWYKVLQVNLNAPFLLTRAVLNLMMHSPDASILFTADTVSDEGRAYWGAYAVAKGGIQTLMKILASELEVNTSVRVNCINPGKVRSNLRINAYPAGNPEEWTDPEAIMATYLYLMGPDSRGVTGQTINAQQRNHP